MAVQVLAMIRCALNMVFDIMAPEISVITPIRDQQLSREAEVAYLQAHGVDMSWEKAQYSINKGLWGTSVGGKETLNSWDNLPEGAYPTQLSKKDRAEIEITFVNGETCGH